MIRCHLSQLMGQRKLKMTDVARATQLSRSTIAALYWEDAVRIDVEAVDKLCQLFSCSVGDLFEYIAENSGALSASSSRSQPG